MPNPRSSNLEVQASRPTLDVVLNPLAVIVWWVAVLPRLWPSTDRARIIQPLANPALPGVAALRTILWIPTLATRCVLHYGRCGIRPIALVLLPVVLYLASEASGEGWIGSGLKITACVIGLWAFIELEFMGA